ncbi:tRNA epoxyqueuosine(34) reductase QueG [Gemmatimonadota bacterium]
MMRELADFAKEEAASLGFALAGICDPAPSSHVGFYQEWVRRGLHGSMAYLARRDSLVRRNDLQVTMPDIRSALVVGDNHFQEDSPGVPEDPSRGVIARYARGEDYHDHVKGRLSELLGRIRIEARTRGLDQEVRGLPYVDTGPILERELAQRAGLGWFGKNTMLLHPRRGSHFFLGVLLLNVELPPDPPFEADHCGSCRACLDVCPTGALLGRDRSGAPVLDARRCISYLTIELKGSIPTEFRPAIGNRIFGCDICQEVCPWNQRFARPTGDPAYQPRPGTDGPDLVELMGLTEEEFAQWFSGSPVKRAKRRGFLRNVAVALGNWRDPAALPALRRALGDGEPLVSEHAAWAMKRSSDPGTPGIF